MTKEFQRTVEDFICEQCGTFVAGNGYTNHCPQCLYSKHVDVHPGDRASDCGGLMPAVSIEQEKGEFVLTHRCEKCGHAKRNKTAPGDNLAAVLR